MYLTWRDEVDVNRHVKDSFLGVTGISPTLHFSFVPKLSKPPSPFWTEITKPCVLLYPTSTHQLGANLDRLHLVIGFARSRHSFRRFLFMPSRDSQALKMQARDAAPLRITRLFQWGWSLWVLFEIHHARAWRMAWCHELEILGRRSRGRIPALDDSPAHLMEQGKSCIHLGGNWELNNL